MAEKKVDLVNLKIGEPDDALFKQSQSLLDLAQDFEIRKPEHSIVAAEHLKDIKALAKEVENKRKEMTVPINQGLRVINDFFRPAKQWLSDAESFMKTKILKYQQDQELIAQEAQRKADEKARKKKERLEARANAARIAGQEAKAEKLEVDAMIQQAPVISSPAPKLQGIQTRTTWKAEVTDKMEFLKFVVEKRPDLIELIQINQSALNAQARSLKGSLDLPGISVYEEKNIAARS